MDTPIEYLAARRIAETGLSAADLAALPMDEFARVTNRPTMGEIAAQAVAPAPQQAGQPAPAQTPDASQQPEGINPNSAEYFHAWRASRTSGGEGKGIFDSVSSRSAEYTNAARAQTGRTAYSQGNVIESPRLEGRFVNQDDMRDTRSAAQRFATPGNSFQL
jgi:hypothetical protein